VPYQRAAELGWRQIYKTFRSASIARAIENAYRDRNCPDAARLRLAAQIAWGIAPGNTARAKGLIRAAHEAQAAFRETASDLGPAGIGFDGVRIHARGSDANSSRVYIDGFDESLSLFQIYQRVLRPGGVALDVGANLGIHSLVMSKCVGFAGHVYAFEPSPSIASRFEANVALNDARNITLRKMGLGEAPYEMHFDDRSDEFNIGLSSFSPGGSSRAPVTSVDSDYHDSRPLQLLKIDVEGMELGVARGARAVLAKHRPALVLEWNDWTLEELRRIVPYAFNAWIIPLNPRHELSPIRSENQKRHGANILVQPA